VKKFITKKDFYWIFSLFKISQLRSPLLLLNTTFRGGGSRWVKFEHATRSSQEDDKAFITKKLFVVVICNRGSLCWDRRDKGQREKVIEHL